MGWDFPTEREEKRRVLLESVEGLAATGQPALDSSKRRKRRVTDTPTDTIHHSEGYQPPKFTGDVLRVMDHENMNSAVFVCESLGGWTGLRLALEHPGRGRARPRPRSCSPAYSIV